jgi:hypothetical protein
MKILHLSEIVKIVMRHEENRGRQFRPGARLAIYRRILFRNLSDRDLANEMELAFAENLK